MRYITPTQRTLATPGAVMGLTRGISFVPRGFALGGVLGSVAGAMFQALWWLEDWADTPEMKRERELIAQKEVCVCVGEHKANKRVDV